MEVKMVDLVQIDAPTPCRWTQNFAVQFDGIKYQVQVLTDDEGIEDTNVNFWLDGDQEELDRDEVPVEVIDFIMEMDFDRENGRHELAPSIER